MPVFGCVWGNVRHPPAAQPAARKTEAPTTGRDSLTITDNRTGKTYEVPVTNGTIRAMDLRQIKVDPKEFGMMSYDPAFNNTAACVSKITYIDGDLGILRYRGYPIEDLAEKSTYLETAYLLIHGELPTDEQLEDWTYHVTHHRKPLSPEPDFRACPGRSVHSARRS